MRQNGSARGPPHHGESNNPAMKHLVIVILLPTLSGGSSYAQDIPAEPVRFELGANSAVVENTITGREIVDYTLRARQGQFMEISMTTDNTANYFNVLTPGENAVAMFTGSTGGNRYEGLLPESGEYRVRVYLVRSAARRGESAGYRLEMEVRGGHAQRDSAAPSRNAANEVPAAPEDGGPRSWTVSGIAGRLNLRESPSSTAPVIATFVPGSLLDNLGCLRADGRAWCDVQPLGGGPRGYVAAEYLAPAISPGGTPATGPDDSALRAGQGDFDATGQIPCSQNQGQPMGRCRFGVARAGGGYATVVVSLPDGIKRAIYFRNGIPIGADTSEADGYHEFRAAKESDLNLIQVGPERYEIPDAVVLGG
jgi:hypothetical protein